LPSYCCRMCFACSRVRTSSFIKSCESHSNFVNIKKFWKKA
jgi:hypothetical protein